MCNPQHDQYNEFIHQFLKDGYCIVKAALSTCEIDRLISKSEEVLQALPNNANKDKILCLVRYADEFVNLLECPKTFPIVVKILQHYNIQCYTSQYIQSSPHSSRRVGWHTDGGQPQAIAINGINAMTSLKVGYALTDMSSDNKGNLEVVPGSQYKRLDWKLYSHDKLNEELEQGEYKGALQVKLQIGDAIIFDQRLWHASAPNYNGNYRKTIYIGYSYGQMRPLDYETFSDEFLCKYSEITQQLLGKRISNFKAYSFYSPEASNLPLYHWYLKNFGNTWI